MRLILAVATALVFAVVPGAARALTVEHGQSHDTVPFVIADVCPFAVQAVGTFDINYTVFWADEAKTRPVRINAAVVESDVFSANGKTLTTMPYHYSGHVYYDAAGQETADFDTGVVAKIRLPDGSLFIAAGRKEILGGQTLLIPDVGTARNIAGFCAALSA
jgi:hypothetical protein